MNLFEKKVKKCTFLWEKTHILEKNEFFENIVKKCPFFVKKTQIFEKNEFFLKEMSQSAIF